MPVDLPKLLSSELAHRLEARQKQVEAALDRQLASGDATHGFYRVRGRAAARPPAWRAPAARAGHLLPPLHAPALGARAWCRDAGGAWNCWGSARPGRRLIGLRPNRLNLLSPPPAQDDRGRPGRGALLLARRKLRLMAYQRSLRDAVEVEADELATLRAMNRGQYLAVSRGAARGSLGAVSRARVGAPTPAAPRRALRRPAAGFADAPGSSSGASVLARGALQHTRARTPHARTHARARRSTTTCRASRPRWPRAPTGRARSGSTSSTRRSTRSGR